MNDTGDISMFFLVIPRALYNEILVSLSEICVTCLILISVHFYCKFRLLI